MGSVDAVEALPFWQVNCPLQERTAECPAFLLNLSEKDRRIIGTPDVDYTLMPWNQVKELVHENQLQAFQRVPSELRRYRAYTYKLAEQYGSVARFILEQRLRWIAPVVPSGNPPFQDDTDIKILWNDWPYGLDPRIVHLVVWTKFDLASDPETGDLTAQARDEIERFVTMTFRSRVPAENVSPVPLFACCRQLLIFDVRSCGLRTGRRSSRFTPLSIFTS